MLAVLPLFHCFGLCVCVNAVLCLGASVILVPQFDAKRFDKAMNGLLEISYGANVEFSSKEEKDKYVIVNMESYERDSYRQQFNKEVVEHVILNYKFIKSIGVYDVYYKE
mgnify:CR=1 FL=1